MKIGRPNPNAAPHWYAYFFKLTTGNDLIEELQHNKRDMIELISSIPETMADQAYAENKWSIKQVFIHLADEERYYTYKAFCYSRRADAHLEVPQGEAYDIDFNAANRTLQDIQEELITVRDASISLYSSMTDGMLDFNDFPGKPTYSARSLGWMTVGHNIHHCQMIKEKYLF